MIKRLLWAGLFFAACTHEVTSDERLERETKQANMKEAITASDLQKLRCDDVNQELAKARNENRPETDRVGSYQDLYESLKGRTAKFDEAMTRNPDLAYQEGSQELVSAREQCIQQTADVKFEFERYIRELVEVPTVQEIKGGTTVTVARLDFGTLKSAIESLNPDDRDQLLNRVSNAEKKVEIKAEPRKKGGGK
ncbi:MAG: hypothetical protein QM723_03770 [Myxococcaceae bacterium]